MQHRLVPHVKTHKMAEIVKMQIDAGISKLKCATIAEAEMLANAGAEKYFIGIPAQFFQSNKISFFNKKIS